MQNNSSFAKLVYVLALIATIIGFAAFSQTPKENSFQKGRSSKDNDTTKSVKRYRNDDGRSLDQLDIEMKKLDVEMNHLNDEMKNLDFSKVQIELDNAMKKIDAEKISALVNESLKKIDFADINKQIDKSISQIDKVKLNEVKKEMEKVRDQLEKQKLDIHVKVPDIDLKKIKIETENAMKNAKQSIEKAKGELQNLRDFTNALQGDGLIDKSKPYKIEVKDGDLYINDKKQPKEVSEKYEHFYKRKNFTINMNEKDNMKINE